MELISDKTQEGFQFVKGFGGIGGNLRYQINKNHKITYVDSDFEGEDGGNEKFDEQKDFM